jgi:hypothetical protein
MAQASASNSVVLGSAFAKFNAVRKGDGRRQCRPFAVHPSQGLRLIQIIERLSSHLSSDLPVSLAGKSAAAPQAAS